MKQTAESVLKEYIQFNDVNQSETIELLPLTIIDAMEEYANENQIAIEFAEWLDDSYFRMGRTNLWSDSTDWEDNLKHTTKELLEIFKKEKGL